MKSAPSAQGSLASQLLPGLPGLVSLACAGLLLVAAYLMPDSWAQWSAQWLKLPPAVMQPLALLATGILFVVVILLCILFQQRAAHPFQQRAAHSNDPNTEPNSA